MRIAVATVGGMDVDLHFGQTAAFIPFYVDERQIRQEEARVVEKYCTNDPNHTFHEQRFGAIVSALQGCQVLLCMRIGDIPRQALKKAGITPIEVTGPIEAALRSTYQALRKARSLMA